jgi:hypothetical protein
MQCIDPPAQASTHFALKVQGPKRSSACRRPVATVEPKTANDFEARESEEERDGGVVGRVSPAATLLAVREQIDQKRSTAPQNNGGWNLKGTSRKTPRRHILMVNSLSCWIEHCCMDGTSVDLINIAATKVT